jgi:hypothetical protein
MTDDKWLDLVARLEDSGKIEERGTDEFEDHPGKVDWFIISSPLGDVRISRTSEPRKIAEKAIYSKRGGSTSAIQKSYDENDIVHRFTIEKYDDVLDDWQEIDAQSLGL